MSYPKQMINDAGDVVLAKQSVHEAALRSQGFEDMPAPEIAPDLPPVVEGCESCAALRAEVEDLKAQLAKALEPREDPAPKVRKPRKPEE